RHHADAERPDEESAAVVERCERDQPHPLVAAAGVFGSFRQAGAQRHAPGRGSLRQPLLLERLVLERLLRPAERGREAGDGQQEAGAGADRPWHPRIWQFHVGGSYQRNMETDTVRRGISPSAQERHHVRYLPTSSGTPSTWAAVRPRSPSPWDHAAAISLATRCADRIHDSMPRLRRSAYVPAKWILPSGCRICGQNLCISPIGNGSISQLGASASWVQSLVSACTIVSRLPG